MRSTIGEGTTGAAQRCQVWSGTRRCSPWEFAVVESSSVTKCVAAIQDTLLRWPWCSPAAYGCCWYVRVPNGGLLLRARECRVYVATFSSVRWRPLVGPSVVG